MLPNEELKKILEGEDGSGNNSSAEKDKVKEKKTQSIFNAMYLSNIVPVPGSNLTLTCDINDKEEAEGMQQAYDLGEDIAVVASSKQTDKVEIDLLYNIACRCRIKSLTKTQSGIRLVALAEERLRVKKFIKDDIFRVEAEPAIEINTQSMHSFDCMTKLRSIIREMVEDHVLPPILRTTLLNAEMTPGTFADALVHLLSKEDPEIQSKFLIELDVEKRLELALTLANEFAQKLIIKKEIEEKVNANIQKSQKEMYLREQLHVINEELHGSEDEVEELTNKVKKLGMPKESEEKVIKEINRMSKLGYGSPELGYIRNFVETVIELPWNKRSDDNIDIVKAREILNEEHYALEKVKDRILETLAVIKLTKKVNAQIICLAGPPGVGKTSIAKSIAKAMNREYVQVSLGGISDESVIRGHRRTYVGAMCGRILAGMKQAGTTNPVFLLDEVDKLTQDSHGDPASALLEVLDPAQNDHFKDSFLELPYDLSQVMFILTANDKDAIPYALRDRMEIISLRSYTEFEKLEIAKNYLIPKQEELAGLPKNTLKLEDNLIRKIISEYTFEGGVRSLERKIASIARKYATFIVTGEKFKDISIENIEDYLGYDRVKELDIYKAGAVGEVVGLSVLGGITGSVMLIESTLSEGKPEVKLTGLPGDMMKESVEQVYTLVKSRAKSLGIAPDTINKNTVHVHVAPVAGKVDGPSAGISMTTAMVSALTNIPTKPHVALTGEISIRGKVLPIGGVRDKLIAADRAGIKLCIIPKDNEVNLRDVPEDIKARMEIKLASTIDEVLEYALERMPAPSA